MSASTVAVPVNVSSDKCTWRYDYPDGGFAYHNDDGSEYYRTREWLPAARAETKTTAMPECRTPLVG